VPRQIVPDNLKAGVPKANWHKPGLNPTYQDFATHYGTAILPARPGRPRDKAKVVGVQVVERWILARLRNQRFFTLGELNGAIGALPATRGAHHPAHCRAVPQWRARRLSSAGRCPAAAGRSNRQLIARLRHAKLRQRATIEDIDWRAPRSPGSRGTRGNARLRPHTHRLCRRPELRRNKKNHESRSQGQLDHSTCAMAPLSRQPA